MVVEAPGPGQPGIMNGPVMGQGVVMDPSVASEMDGGSQPATCRAWTEAEYLLWWMKGGGLSSPLVTGTTNPFATDAAGNNVSGGLGRDGTSVLSSSNLGFKASSGGRVGFGVWLDPRPPSVSEARGFFLIPPSVTKTFSSAPDGNNVVGIPIIDTANVIGGGENAIIEAFPGVLRGYDTVTYTSRLWGGEANALFNLGRGERFMLNGFAGFRYLGLNESLTLTGASSGINGNLVSFLGNNYVGQVISVDQWKTSNNFYGGQLGIQGQTSFGSLFVSASAQCGLGTTNQTLTSTGASTLVTANGISTTNLGGTLVLPSNAGRVSRSDLHRGSRV